MGTTGNATPVDLDVLHALGIDRNGRWRRWIIRGIWLAAAAGVAIFIAVRLVRGARPPGLVYQTQGAERHDVLATVTASGTLEPWTTVDLGPEISGRVRAVHADFNDRVVRGQIMVELDTDLLAAQFAQAESQVALAAASLEQARVTRDETRLNLGRAESLRGRGVSSAAEVDAAQAAARRADAAVAAGEAQLRAARASLQVARTTLGKATLRAPVDGVVLSRSVDVGQTVVAALQAPVLFRLAEDLGRMRLIVDVDEADVGRVREGLEATFTVAAYPSRTFTAHVTSVRNAAQVRENVVTYQAVLDVDNREGLLRPGMTGTADIAADARKNAPTVPNAALRYRPATAASDDLVTGARVWVLRDGKPVAVTVTPGVSDGVRTVVGEGEIEVGAPVVVGELEAAR